MTATAYNISSVERDTGLSKDVLRMWEKRYGFPQPERDEHGERLYPRPQVERLRLLKRLIDMGHRPGKLMACSDEELGQLGSRRAATAEVCAPADGSIETFIGLVKQHDAAAYHQGMQQRMARLGMEQFVLNTIAPLTQAIGEAWEAGRIEVFEEHLFTELTKRILRQTLSTLPQSLSPPCILLTSVPDEPHILGLLMAETLLTLEGARCIALGTEMPLLDIARAAEAHRADIVALSFSQAFPRRQIVPLLGELRASIAPQTAIWAGGAGVSRLELPEGVTRFDSLEQIKGALQDWRQAHA